MLRNPVFLLLLVFLAAALACDLRQLFGRYTCPACRQQARHGRGHACDWSASAQG